MCFQCPWFGAVQEVVTSVFIGVGRCSDLGGGDIFLNNKNVISLRNNAYMQYHLQYCNEIHYVNSGYSWGASRPLAPPLPTPMVFHTL